MQDRQHRTTVVPVKPDVTETILMVPASTLPGTDAELLARLLADAVVHLPVAAAALIGTAEVPPDIQRIAQE